jgi:periplasmic copper chaperone A
MKLRATYLISAGAAAFFMLVNAAQAQTVEVKGAWARASVPGQKATGAFMTLSAKDGATLVGVSSPAAGVAEVHEMKMDGDVMRMHALPALALPAGQVVELKPGGYHVMLQDLKAPLAKGSTVAITLVFKDAKGVQRRQVVQVPVSLGAGGGMDGMAHGK